MWNALNQIYRFGYFHADPHPANLIVLRGRRDRYVDFGIVGKLDQGTTESLRYFAQSLFAGHIGEAVDEFMRFLTPSSATDVARHARDLVEAMKSYSKAPGSVPTESPLRGIFEIEMLAIVRRHAMALAPDAVRYLKAVLTAEAMVRSWTRSSTCAAHENRFFGRLMEMELGEMLTLGGAARWLLDARRRLDRRRNWV